MQVCRRRFQVHTTPITPASHPSHCLNFFGGCAATSPSLRSLNLCLSLGDNHDSSEAVEDHGRGHGKGPCDAIGAILKRHASTRFDIGASSRRELQSDYWPSAVDKCIVERYRELANQLRNRSAAAATLPDLVPCLSSSSDSSEEEEEFEYETQGMYWRHLDADA